MNKTLAWIDSFSKEQIQVLEYALIKADCFLNEVSPTDDISSDKRTAFLAGFYLGLDYKGENLPPEPPKEI
jgi:hypothetical protein